MIAVSGLVIAILVIVVLLIIVALAVVLMRKQRAGRVLIASKKANTRKGGRTT